MFLTTHVTVCICHAELKTYLLTYLAGSETSWGRNVQGRTDKGAKRPQIMTPCIQ